MFGAIGLVLAIFILVFLFSGGVKNTTPSDSDKNLPQNSSSTQSKTVLPVPVGIVVPDANAANTGGIGAPTSVKPAGGTTGIDLRNFNISVNSDKVLPDTIAVYQNDIITLNFSAVDKDYSFVQPDSGLSWTVKMGSSKSFQSQWTNTGKFIYYCASCGGPSKGPIGYIVVVPNK